MRNLIILLFLIAIIGAGIGFYLKTEDPETGELLIGLSIVLGFFIVMPLFIYHRWKHRSVKDYMLTKESIIKMREYNDAKDANKRD